MQKLQRYTACPGEHYLFDGDKHGCQKPECQTGQGKSYTYNPLIPRLKSLYATPEVAKLLQQHQSVDHEDDTMSDIQHSPKWKEIYGPGGIFENDPRAICLEFSSDGFSPFHHSTTDSYSIEHQASILLNLPADIRCKPGFAILHGLIPGNFSFSFVLNSIQLYLVEFTTIPYLCHDCHTVLLQQTGPPCLHHSDRVLFLYAYVCLASTISSLD